MQTYGNPTVMQNSSLTINLIQKHISCFSLILEPMLKIELNQKDNRNKNKKDQRNNRKTDLNDDKFVKSRYK